MGALTNEARAEDSVAEKIPAVIRGPKPDTRLITWTNTADTVLLRLGSQLQSVQGLVMTDMTHIKQQSWFL